MLTLKNRWFFIILSWFSVIISAFVIFFSLEKNVRVDSDLDVKEKISSRQDLRKLMESEVPVTNILDKSDEVSEISYVVKKNDSFNKIFDDIQISYAVSANVINSLKKIYNPRDIRQGDVIFISYYNSKDSKEIKRLVVVDDLYLYEVSLQQGIYQAYKIKKKRNLRIRSKEIVIQSSLFVDALAKNIPAAVIIDVINKYSYNVDFQRDVRRGDKFSMIYEEYYDNNKKYLGSGKILYVSFTSKKGVKKIYYFEDQNSRVRYFNQEGANIKSVFLMTPINGARISSGYGYRRHPILGYNKMHAGIDFAAPRGTPILAAADGVVVRIGYYGSYGHNIILRHVFNSYKTSYSHMSGYKKGLKKGSRVKQGDVIGYVGSTGRSTGPHLHYELIHKGKKINPRTAVQPRASYKLKGQSLQRFLEKRKLVDRLVSSMNYE